MKYLWWAVDHEGEVLESYDREPRQGFGVEIHQESEKRHGRTKVIVTDRLRAYGAALKEIGALELQETGGRLNKRTENSHVPFR